MLDLLDAPAQLLDLCRKAPKSDRTAVPYIADGFEPDTDEVAAFVERWSHDAPEAVQGCGGSEITKQVIMQGMDLGLTAARVPTVHVCPMSTGTSSPRSGRS